MRFLLPLAGLLLVACAPSVELTKSGKAVELLTQADLGQGAMKCTEQGSFEVVAREIEQPASRGTVAQIKARNQVGKKGYTHALVWPGATFPCDREGNEKEDGEYTCELVPVTAYDCIAGR